MAKPIKPAAVQPGDRVRVVFPSSPAEQGAIDAGLAELSRLGYRPDAPTRTERPAGFFASALAFRQGDLQEALRDDSARAVICGRGGYGSSALLAGLKLAPRTRPKLLVGYSDATALLIYVWQRCGWTSVHGPMVAAGLDRGAGQPCGYDRESFIAGLSGASSRWGVPLDGETLVAGEASGRLLGGCVTLIETALGTPWELDTRGAILLLEDRGLKPYQLDRLLLHLAQAGKFRGVRGFVLGDFPDCDPPPGSRLTAREVCKNALAQLRVPIVFGAPLGHSARPMLTVPLGVRARLQASGKGQLEILEAAVVPTKNTKGRSR